MILMILYSLEFLYTNDSEKYTNVVNEECLMILYDTKSILIMSMYDVIVFSV